MLNESSFLQQNSGEKRRGKEKKEKRSKSKKGSKKVIEDFAQSPDNYVPLFVEKCITFIEQEGLDSEGLYRVPGNRAHVDLLFQKFEEGNHILFHNPSAGWPCCVVQKESRRENALDVS